MFLGFRTELVFCCDNSRQQLLAPHWAVVSDNHPQSRIYGDSELTRWLMGQGFQALAFSLSYGHTVSGTYLKAINGVIGGTAPIERPASVCKLLARSSASEYCRSLKNYQYCPLIILI